MLKCGANISKMQMDKPYRKWTFSFFPIVLQNLSLKFNKIRRCGCDYSTCKMVQVNKFL